MVRIADHSATIVRAPHTVRDQKKCLLRTKVMQVAVAKEMSLSKITIEYDAEIGVKCSLLKSEFLLGSHISYIIQANIRLLDI